MKSFFFVVILSLPLTSRAAFVNGTDYAPECIEALKKKVLSMPNFQSKTIDFTNAYGEKHTNKKNAVQMVFDHQLKSGTDCFGGSVLFNVKVAPDKKNCSIEKSSEVSDGDCRTEP